MKTLHISIIVGISFLSFVFLMIPQNVYAHTCAVDAPPLTPQYYYLHSDSVFVGTVSSISNYTAHQWNVKFNVEKSWKGNQHPTITTYSLVACGYSFVEGEKYLVFASSSPPDYDPWATKPFVNAQNEIALLDSSQFQTQESANEILYKKLVNARDALSNMMGSRMSKMPISFAGVNDLNFTLDVGIADKKASLPSGAQAYKQKLEEIVGNVPIRILYAEYATALPEILTQHGTLSPLKQFKSGIKAEDVTCKEGFERLIKGESGHPVCVKPQTAQKLVERGWTKQESYYVDPHMSPKVTLSDYFYDGIDKDDTIVSINNRTYYQTTLNYTIDNLRKDTSIQFHDVTFAFPEGILNTPGGSMTILDVKFPDGYEETYGRKMMNQDGSGSGSGIGIPSKFGPPARTSITVLSNHVIPQAGLTIYHDKLKLLVSTSPINMLSENDCEQFRMAPVDHALEVYPVLVLQQNSIGCTKLTYTINYMYDDNRTGSSWPQVVNSGDMFHVGNYNYVTHVNMFSVTSGKDYTHSFQIAAIPETVDLAKYPVGSQFTVTLVIRPLPNATGFYDYSIEEVPCDSYPLAIGYSLDQVNSSDFSKGMISMHNHSCFNAPYTISSVQVSGMDVKQVKFQ